MLLTATGRRPFIALGSGDPGGLSAQTMTAGPLFSLVACSPRVSAPKVIRGNGPRFPGSRRLSYMGCTWHGPARRPGSQLIFSGTPMPGPTDDG